MTQTPSLREVLVALEEATSLIPGFECVIAPLPPHVQAAQVADVQLFLDPDQPVDEACAQIVATVEELIGAGRGKCRHLRLVPSPDKDLPIARSDGIA